MKKTLHPVIFAGAGPGDPELITMKSMNALKTADLIIYAGSLVPKAVLKWKGSETKIMSSEDMDLENIIDTIRTYHDEGKKVVRLHTGDPSLYGAIFEQIRELEKIEIPYEIIPGVTAAFAASAKMNMEYTLPEVTQTLIFTRISGRTAVPDSESLDKLAAHKSSMAIYLSIGHAEKVQSVLARHYGEDALCAIAYKVSHPEEKIVYTKVKKLLEACENNGITRHALIIVGKALEAATLHQDILKSKLYDSTFSHGYRSAEK